MSLLTRQTLLHTAARSRAAAQQKAEAEGRHESVAEALKEKERRLAEAKGELDKVHKEARHVDSQAGTGCTELYLLYLPLCAVRRAWGIAAQGQREIVPSCL